MPNRPASHRVAPSRRHTTQLPAVQRGYDWCWHKASKAFLSANPLCFYCEMLGLVVAAQHTDHYDPPTGKDDPLFWDEGNWRASCKYHNESKGDMMGNAFVRKLMGRQNEPTKGKAEAGPVDATTICERGKSGVR